MYERRRQAASLVALLVVTPLFIWSCSSRDHEGAPVTTSGGAGSEVKMSGSRPGEAGSDAELGVGGTLDAFVPPTTNDAGAEDEPTTVPGSDLAAGGEAEAGRGSGGSGSHAGSAQATGGTVETSGAAAAGSATSSSGAPGAGAASAGAPAVGGAPAVVEPVCDPADDPSRPDMFLPCDVSTALYVCRNCHSKPPVQGVFTSYVSYSDIKNNAAQIYAVIKSGTMPWPPYTLSAWQKSTALKWLGKNGSCALGATKSCQ